MAEFIGLLTPLLFMGVMGLLIAAAAVLLISWSDMRRLHVDLDSAEHEIGDLKETLAKLKHTVEHPPPGVPDADE